MSKYSQHITSELCIVSYTKTILSVLDNQGKNMQANAKVLHNAMNSGPQ